MKEGSRMVSKSFIVDNSLLFVVVFESKLEG
jgi:hypothetical protein